MTDHLELWRFGPDGLAALAFVPDLTWQGRFTDHRGNRRRVFVLTGTSNHVCTTIVTDEKLRLACWSPTFCRGPLHSARVVNDGSLIELTIVADTLGLHSPSESRGIYRFQIARSEIIALPVEWDRGHAESQWQAIAEAVQEANLRGEETDQ